MHSVVYRSTIRAVGTDRTTRASNEKECVHDRVKLSRPRTTVLRFRSMLYHVVAPIEDAIRSTPRHHVLRQWAPSYHQGHAAQWLLYGKSTAPTASRAWRGCNPLQNARCIVAVGGCTTQSHIEGSPHIWPRTPRHHLPSQMAGGEPSSICQAMHCTMRHRTRRSSQSTALRSRSVQRDRRPSLAPPWRHPHLLATLSHEPVASYCAQLLPPPRGQCRRRRDHQQPPRVALQAPSCLLCHTACGGRGGRWSLASTRSAPRAPPPASG